MERAREKPSIAKPARSVVLIGVSGSGKTVIGKRLAPSLGATYLEGDDFHSSANIAKMRSGTPLTDRDRQPWLAKLGHAIGEHCRHERPVVAACSALRRCYRDALVAAARQELVFVHLTISPEILEARVQARQQHFMPASLLRSQLATLEPLEGDEVGVAIAETGTPMQTVEAIRRWLRRHEGRPHERPSHRPSPASPVSTREHSSAVRPPRSDGGEGPG